MSDSLFGWELRDGAPESTCDSCAESKPLPYAWPETEAWLCAECWHDATEIDRASAEVLALRGALQALVDATPTVGISDRHGFSEDAVWATHVQHPEALAAARAVAVAVLTGPETGLTGENLRDRGMRQAGGVSDGPQ